MVHLLDKRPTAKPASALNMHRVWCGQEVPNGSVVVTLTAVQCARCRKAFARVLASLPNVEDK